MNELETRPPIRQLAELKDAESNIWYVRKKNKNELLNLRQLADLGV